jgi:hypothetical protein
VRIYSNPAVALFPQLPLAAFWVVVGLMWGTVLVIAGDVGRGILMNVAVAELGYAACRGIRANNGWITWPAIIGIPVVIFMIWDPRII